MVKCGMDQNDRADVGDGPVVSEGGRSPSTLSTGQGAPSKTGTALGPLAPGQRWSAGRKREVVLRLMRGESAELLSRELGLPIVKLECEFARPSRMGETVSLALSLTKVGQRSIGLDIVGRGDDGVRFVAHQVLVTTSLDTGESIGIPHDIRAALQREAASPLPNVHEALR